jgi:hypothetical protein
MKLLPEISELSARLWLEYGQTPETGFGSGSPRPNHRENQSIRICACEQPAPGAQYLYPREEADKLAIELSVS